MIISGWQKLSLIDYPQKISSVVFTQGCLFRCPYCHNPELIPLTTKTALPEEKFWQYLQERKNMLEGVCITGGEPTLHKDLPEFMAKIKALGLLVKLDTNGTNPKMVQDIIDQGLADYFAMDLKNTWDKYDQVAKSKNPTALKNCRKTFKLIQNSGIDHEFRTTVFPQVHQEKDFVEMVGYLKPSEKYFLQNIRYLKNLDPNLDKPKVLDVPGIISRLRQQFPQIIIEER